MAHPGKKLNFMGNEFAQFIEWNFTQGLDWLLLDYDHHRQMREYVRMLNQFYLKHPAMWENDSDWNGFQWMSCDDRDCSVVAFRRISRSGREVIAVFNFCPVLREDYPLPLPKAGWYEPVMNSDSSTGRLRLRTRDRPCPARQGGRPLGPVPHPADERSLLPAPEDESATRDREIIQSGIYLVNQRDRRNPECTFKRNGVSQCCWPEAKAAV